MMLTLGLKDELLNTFLVSVCQYFIKNFCINVHKKKRSVILCVESLHGLGNEVIAAS